MDEKATFHYPRLLQAPFNLALNTCRDGAATASLGNLCQCLTTLTGMILFPIFKMWTSGINEAAKMALLAWEKETGIELVQINGQRHYGGPPPGWEGGPPPAGTEVYIARLPQDIYENTLIPLFQSVGRLYEFRLMMTFSGLNRGFAYARYASLQDAQRAIATFHRFQLRQGCAIIVCWSTQKRELLVSGLPASLSQQELEARLHMVTEGIHSVTLHASPCQKEGKLAVLKYKSHKAAALAKKALMEVELPNSSVSFKPSQWSCPTPQCSLNPPDGAARSLRAPSEDCNALMGHTSKTSNQDLQSPGNLRLGKEMMRVDWLDPQLKKKLQHCEEKPLSSWVQGGESLAVPRLVAVPLSPENVLECLNMVCWKHHLKTPLFITRCVQVNPNGWQKFWYKVVIPGYHAPISGFTWVSPEKQGQSKQEKAKVVAALHILRVLGCQLM